MSSSTIIIVDDDRWLEAFPLEFWQESFDRILCEIAKARGVEVNLLLTNSNAISQLNKEFRGKEAPTNVLSFPQYDDACNIDTIIRDDNIFIGDIAMSFEIIMSESEEFGVDFKDRCFHLFVHGVLHLLGLDHECKEKADEMENLEIDILSSLGVKNPYIL